jgi:Tfp pilus assembly protein PilO
MDAVNQLITILVQLNWGKTLGIGVLVAGLYYIASFDDGSVHQEQLSQFQSEYTQTEKDIAATKEALSNADRFEREVKDTVDQFTRITDFMPEKISGSELINLVSESCKSSGLKLLKVEPRQGGGKIEFYETSKVMFSVEGTFAQTLVFLSSLSRIPKLMTIDDFLLDVATNNSNQETPRLVASGVLVGYRYVRTIAPSDKKTENKPGDANGSAGSNVSN